MIMLTKYIEQKIKSAKYKIIDDSTFFGEIPGIRGVWAHARSLDGCRNELQEVLEDWLLLKIRNREKIAGFSIRFDRKNLVRR